MTQTLSIARDFSQFPAGRHRGDGPFTGEKFREDVLLPYLKAGVCVVLDIDGVAGLPSSFLEEIFGGLVRDGFDPDELRKLIEIRVTDPDLAVYPAMAWRFATEARSVH
jgi:hypothetical protein